MSRDREAGIIGKDGVVMDYLFVAIGGLLGAFSRGALMYQGLDRVGGFPLTTVLINLTGSFVFALIMRLSEGRIRIDQRLRLAITTGFLGAYTTFSTYSVDVVKLFLQGQYAWAMVYMIITSIGCIIAAYLGFDLGGRFGSQQANNNEE